MTDNRADCFDHYEETELENCFMIGKHCGQMMQTVTDNKFYFRRRCSVCGVTFKQKKRQPKNS